MKKSILLGAALTGLALPAPGQELPLREVHRPIPATYGELLLEDLDGDGNVDLVVSARELILGDGRAGFAPALTPFPPLADSFPTQALGDIDGDGDADLLAVEDVFCWQPPCTPAPIRHFSNQGGGLFAEQPFSPQIQAGAVTGLVLADVDGSGSLDLYVATYAVCDEFTCFGGQDQLFLNDGLGGFLDVTATHLPAGPSWSSLARMEDLDLDGDPDLWLARGGDGFTGPSAFADQDEVLLNDGSGVFTPLVGALPVDLDFTDLALFFDADGDLDPDLLIDDNLSTHFLRNDGTGRFLDASAALPAPRIQQAAAADLDLDGDLDLLVQIAPFGLHRYRNDGTGQFIDEGLFSRFDYGTPYARDLDGDGDPDVLLATGFTQGVRLLLNDGQGQLVDLTNDMPLALKNVVGVDLGDVDGDGDLDAVWIADVATAELYRNDGHGRFTPESAGSLSAEFDGYTDLQLGDADGDGDLDAFVAASAFPLVAPSQSAVHANDGAGGFGLLQEFHLSGTAWRVRLGDLDADGDLDAAYGRLGPDALLLNDGAGFFLDRSNQLPASSGDSRGMGLGDVDGDGDPDLVLANHGANALLLNDGAAVFSDASSAFPPNASDSETVALADMDSDGDLDVFIGNDGFFGDPDHLLENTGAGGFIDAGALLPAAVTRSVDAAFVDLDVDGLPDLVLAEWVSFKPSPDRVLMNRGAAGFEAFVLPGSAPSRNLATGDVDGDGDEDVFVGNQGDASLYRSLHRQLAERRPSSVGKDLRLELYGGPSQAWTLFLSGSSASIPIPGLGTLRLDPAGLQFVGAGSFGANGWAEFVAAIPAAPSLVGMSVYFQALSGSPLQLGNLERVKLGTL